MLISTLTSEGRATIPSEVRKLLQLKAGDKVIFEIIDHKAILQKAQPFDQQYHHALSQTLSEWSSPEDPLAYSITYDDL